jgi:hypothetical protein
MMKQKTVKGAKTKMARFDINFEEQDFADEMINAIEKDYGRSIARIPYFERNPIDPNSFIIKIIFADFKLLEAEISVVPSFDIASIHVEGIYY